MFYTIRSSQTGTWNNVPSVMFGTAQIQNRYTGCIQDLLTIEYLFYSMLIFPINQPSCKLQNKQSARLRNKPMLRRGALLAVRGHGGVISSCSHVWSLCYVLLTVSILTDRLGSVAPMAGAGLVGGARGVGGAELDRCGVLQRVLTCLHLKRRCPHPHQPPLLTCFSLTGHLSRRSPADHAAGHEECQGYQQKKRSNDDGWISTRYEGNKGEGSHQGDVDASQHDAQTTGAAQGWRGQALVPQGALPGDALGSRWSGGFFSKHHVSLRAANQMADWSLSSSLREEAEGESVVV